MRLRFIIPCCLVALAYASASANFVSFQAASTAAATCSSSVLDAFAASPGAYTAAYSHRKLRAAYAGSAVQLQRSSDSTTLDVGFTGCNPNTTPTTSFCSTTTLASGTTASARVAYPTGTVIHVFNQGPSAVFYASGNSSVAATTASAPLNFRQGVNITVGADTNLASIIGTGYGIDGGAGSATLFLTNCGVSKVYDQSANSFDMAPATVGLINQMGYIPTGQGSLPLAFGCLSGCAYKATDSATYKTSAVNTFSVMTYGEDVTTSNFYYGSIGYPNTTSSNGADFRWGLINTSAADVLTPIVNSAPFTNTPEGFGGLWRGQGLTQYDYNVSASNISIRWNGGTVFFNTVVGAAPTYPNAVGLYMMGDAAGNSTPGTWAESLVASGTQTARDGISANQVSYWGITSGAAATSALTNPLSDGFNWNQLQLGSFGGSPKQTYTVNGSVYNAESSWNTWTQWQCSNCISTGGRLGDLWRFQQTFSDVWDGTNRSELDGSGSAQFNTGTTFWIAYAVYIEPGTPYTSQWNINGQMHNNSSPALVCCIFTVNSNSNSVTDTWFVSTFNASTGATTSTTSGVALTRGRWYHFVFQVTPSNTGTSDTFNVWLDTVTPGTMVQIATNSGASLFGGNANNASNYWKHGIYRQTGVPLPTFGVRYGNMQICSSGADCTSKYGVSDLSAQTTTPLADPGHSFLLRRDLNPAANDNTPMWLNAAA